MPRSILQIVNAVQAELGLEQSSAVFNNTNDLTATQMGALANRVLDEMRQMNRWTALQNEYDIVVSAPISTTGNMVAHTAVITNIGNTTGVVANFWSVSGAGLLNATRVISVDSPTQVTLNMQNNSTADVTAGAIKFCHDTFPMPSDFDYFNNNTMWDRTNFWRLIGPDSPQRDQWIRSGITPLGPRRHFRKLGPYTSQFRLWPPPSEIATPLQLVFEYLSNSAVMVNGALGLNTNFAEYFVNDNDITILDEDALIMGIKWMFWEVKGFGSYVTLQNRWIDFVNRLAARDGGAQTLDMARRQANLLISPANVQDGNWPGATGPNTS